MCWSFGASTVLAILGIIASFILYKSKKYHGLWIPLFYFSIMELLQAVTYLVLNRCSLPLNQIFTVLGYFHIAFQPFFINNAFMFFIPKEVRQKISGMVYSICFIGALLTLAQLIPFTFAGMCRQGVDVLCGTNICSASGSWHLAWFLPLNGLAILTFFGYTLPAFILPLIYGAWKPTIYHIIFGPLLAWLLSPNPNEFPATWCLFSIAFILAVFYKPLLNWMYTKKWYFWNYPTKK